MIQFNYDRNWKSLGIRIALVSPCSAGKDTVSKKIISNLKVKNIWWQVPVNNCTSSSQQENLAVLYSCSSSWQRGTAKNLMPKFVVRRIIQWIVNINLYQVQKTMIRLDQISYGWGFRDSIIGLEMCPAPLRMCPQVTTLAFICI